MKKLVMSLTAVLLLMAMAFISGCTKPEEPNNGGNEGNNENEGGDTPEPGVVINGPDLMTFTVNGVSFDMVKVEGGTFWMGAQSTNQNGQNYDEDANESESLVHQVALSDYYIGKYEVSQELWQAVMGTNPSHFQGELLPVENVGPNSVKDFLHTLNARLSSETNGLQFKLPTEAQWEFAAKGGKESQGYKYSGSNNSSAVAWYSDNSGQQTHPIGSKEPNELFLYDMSGNVFEWCNDYAGGYVGVSQTDPIGPSQEFMGDNPGWIIRGGSWKVGTDYCRSSARDAWNKGENFIGFRLALSGNVGQATVPGPRTGNVSDITTNSAHVTGSLWTDGGSYQTEWGFYYGTSPDLAANGTKIPVSQFENNYNYSGSLTNLQPGTKYYVCAYAKNSVGTGYGEAVEFITNGHAWVDLGLPSGTLWATCNVGAMVPEEYGDYFAWGETQTKSTYEWNNYQYGSSPWTLTKYCHDSTYVHNGFIDDLTILQPEDDAASTNWGGNWRMPTKEEFQELYDNTTQTWTTQNGVNGCRFTATNGNTLFLPAGGVYENEPYNVGIWGSYWSSSLNTDGFPRHAKDFDFNSNECIMSIMIRCSGQSVRPVRSTRQN